jgi:hypothetical protein
MTELAKASSNLTDRPKDQDNIQSLSESEEEEEVLCPALLCSVRASTLEGRSLLSSKRRPSCLAAMGGGTQTGRKLHMPMKVG